MKTEQIKTKKTLQIGQNRADDALQIAATAILLLAGTWLVLKISKEMLKELEAMGL